MVREKQRVLRVARRMIRRKIQRFEIVVIGFDCRPLGDGVSEVLEHANDFVLRPNDGVFGTDGATNAGKGDVDGKLAVDAGLLHEGSFHLRFDFTLEFVDALAHFALRIFRRRF